MKKAHVIISVSALLFWAACQNQSNENTNPDNSSPADSAQTDTAQSEETVVYTLPTPVQMVSMIRMQGIKYNAELLNPTQRRINYASNFSKALNLGIYCVDLGYATFYDQKQMAMDYISAVKKLSEELGINGAYEANAVKKYETQFNNKDSLIHVILDGFNKAHNYLGDNDRKDVAILCFTGCYIEGLYLTASIAQKSENPVIAQKIVEQKLYLNNLLALLENYSDNEEVSEIMDKLTELQKQFDAITITEIKEADGTVKYDTNNIKVTQEQLKNIVDKVNAIRAEIV